MLPRPPAPCSVGRCDPSAYRAGTDRNPSSTSRGRLICVTGTKRIGHIERGHLELEAMPFLDLEVPDQGDIELRSRVCPVESLGSP